MNDPLISSLLKILNRYETSRPKDVSSVPVIIGSICQEIEILHQHGKSVDVAIIIDIIHELEGKFPGEVQKLIGLLRFTSPSKLGLAKLIDVGRDSKYLSSDNLVRLGTELAYIVKNDKPPSIMLPGERQSYVQLPAIYMSCPQAFTLTMWMQFSVIPQPTDVLLFRGRTTSGGIEAVLSNFENNSCLIVIRSYVERSNSVKERQEVQGKLSIKTDQFHLLSFSHSFGAETASFTVCVDGNVAMEKELLYPFSSNSEGQWTFCVGLKGNLSSVCLYPSEISFPMLQLFYECGPFTTSLDEGVSVPQESYDSGLSVLGSRLSKGHDALVACSISPIFCFTASHFAPTTLLPITSVGRVKPEHIEMVSQFDEIDSSKIPITTGACRIQLNNSWIQQWIAIGGTSVILYLISKFCQFCSIKASPDVGRFQSLFMCYLSLLGAFIEHSADLKDLFIQEHGFHVLSAAIQKVDGYAKTLDPFFVEKLFEFVSYFKSDMHSGDCICAALQGIILDFRLWAKTSFLTRERLLTSTSDLISENSQAIYDCIGVQRILDIIRFHAVNGEDPEWEVVDTNIFSDVFAPTKNIPNQNIVRIMDACQRILSITLDASIRTTHDAKLNSSPDIAAVIYCLESSTSSDVVERLIRILTNLRYSSPKLLRTALKETRFTEVSILHLLCDKSLKFSTEVRRGALINFLWALQEQLGKIPGELSSRKAIFSYLYSKSRSRNLETSRRFRDGLNVIKQIMPSVDYVWLTINMVSDEMKNSMNDIGWVYSQPAHADLLVSDDIVVTPVDDVLDILTTDGLLGSIESMLIIPLLNALLPRASLPFCEKTLHSLSFALKQNETHCSLISLLPDTEWIKKMLTLIVLAEDKFSKLPPTNVLIGNQQDDWTALATFGDNVILNDTNHRIAMCTDFAIDAFAHVLVFKIRYHGPTSWDTFLETRKILQMKFPTHEEKVLKRICLLCIQKLSRASDGWCQEMLYTVGNILIYIEEMQFCGNELLRIKGFNRDKLNDDSKRGGPAPVVNLLDNFVVNEDAHAEKEQMLSFVVDVLNSIRRYSEKNYLGRQITKVILPGIRIIMGCFQSCSEVLADRVCSELQSLVINMAEQWTFCHEDAFKDIIFSILKSLESAYQNRSIAAGIRERYSAAIVTIVQYFVQMRYTAGSPGTSTLPHHVITLIDMLSSAEGCCDVDTIFMLLHMHMNPNDSGEAISFVEEEKENCDDTSSPNYGESGVIVDFITPQDQSPHQQENNELPSGTDFLIDQQDFLDTSAHQDTSNKNVDLLNLPEQTRSAGRRTDYFSNWIQSRRRKLLDRHESDKLRLSKEKENIDSSFESIVQFWKSLSRKIEIEVLLEDVYREWKLGVAHEGPFPARKRLVLHPKYDVVNVKIPTLKTSISMSTEDVKEVLSKSGAITNIINNPGSGWGLIDADGSEEGYGVVGIASEEGGTLSLSTHSDEVHSPEFEYHHAEQRGIETGPCPAGCSRFVTESAIREAEVILVTSSGNYFGILTFSNKEILFVSTKTNGEGNGHYDDSATVSLTSKNKIKRRRWNTHFMSAVYLRRYRLRDSALEVFLSRGKHRNFFVDFGSAKSDIKRRNDFATELMKHAPSGCFNQWPGMSIYRLITEHKIQQRWLDGEISNFDYLMALNTLAGRSFNDLCQYPVMPWVISQYISDQIDLRDPNNFRDLSKPMGAINQDRLEDFLDRYKSFGDPDIPPFMYGSHYSTMVGVVLHFLIRLHPFSDLHQSIQSGHFDVSDRLFSSIPRTWDHNTTMLSEVKEITPEWFYLPDFLRNINKFNFGAMQSGEIVNDVVLPPWAPTPEDFIRINREALESPYVSAHLHEWIDLIFGYKQRGPAAVEANNVFYYLTYYGAINRDAISDEATKKAIELQIAHFGQCPIDLFKTPHPAKRHTSVPRLLKDNFDDISKSFIRPSRFEEFIAIDSRCTLVNRISNCRVVCIAIRSDKIICAQDNGVLESFRYSTSESTKTAVAAYTREMNLKKRRGTGSNFNKGTPSDYSTTYYGDQDDDVISFAYEDGSGFVEPQTHTHISSGHQNKTSADPELIFRQEASNIDVVLAVEKEITHFELIPRLPLAHPRRSDVSVEKRLYDLQAHLTSNSRIAISFGRIDGGIAVREIDRNATILSGGDFRSHKTTVSCVSSDEIPGGSTDVIVSSDINGTVLVWTISLHSERNSKKRSKKRFVISRRPQRKFQVLADDLSCCDISWKMGIVLAASKGLLHVFSVERNEQLHVIDVRDDIEGLPAFSHKASSKRIWMDQSVVMIKYVALSDDGAILVYFEIKDGSKRNFIASYTISGVRMGILQVPSPVTALTCPARGSVVILGQQDGSVMFLNFFSLDLIYHFQPASFCIKCIIPGGGRGSVVIPEPEESAIISIQVGPDVRFPTLLCIASASGALYVKTLPDFIPWDKARQQSTIAQLVIAPIQAVKQSAHHLTVVASEAAGNFAANAKQFADDTLAKLNNNKLFKGMGSIFGVKPSDSSK